MTDRSRWRYTDAAPVPTPAPPPNANAAKHINGNKPSSRSYLNIPNLTWLDDISLCEVSRRRAEPPEIGLDRTPKCAISEPDIVL